MRNRLVVVITAAAAAAGLAGCGSAGGSSTSAPAATVKSAADVTAAKGTSVVMGHFLGPYMVDVAKRAGLLGNLHVTLSTLASGSAALPLMLSGRMAGVTDIGVPPLVTAAAKKMPLKIVWYAGSDPGGIYVKPSLQSPRSLIGQNLAAPAGSIAHIALAEYLEQHGVRFSQVKFVNLPPASIVASYKTGQIAGASIWTPVTTGLRSAGARLMASQPETAFTVFTAGFIRSHRAAVQLYLCDLAKAQDLRRATPGTCLRERSRRWRTPRRRGWRPRCRPIRRATRPHRR